MSSSAAIAAVASWCSAAADKAAWATRAGWSIPAGGASLEAAVVSALPASSTLLVPRLLGGYSGTKAMIDADEPFVAPTWRKRGSKTSTCRTAKG
eukprot:scaffold326353_cov55-Tisochrysis_lutea.AAC.5